MEGTSEVTTRTNPLPNASPHRIITDQLITRELMSGKNKPRSCARIKSDEVVSGKEEEAGEAKERGF